MRWVCQWLITPWTVYKDSIASTPIPTTTTHEKWNEICAFGSFGVPSPTTTRTLRYAQLPALHETPHPPLLFVCVCKKILGGNTRSSHAGHDFTLQYPPFPSIPYPMYSPYGRTDGRIYQRVGSRTYTLRCEIASRSRAKLCRRRCRPRKQENLNLNKKKKKRRRWNNKSHHTVSKCFCFSFSFLVLKVGKIPVGSVFGSERLVAAVFVLSTNWMTLTFHSVAPSRQKTNAQWRT